ncbi:MAG: hypothetical protein ACRCZK_01585 [Oscillospiraceae bacterium]
MISDLIAVISVFVIVNGFIILILGQVSANLRYRAKNEFITRLNVYDDIIDNKILEIKELENKIEDISREGEITYNQHNNVGSNNASNFTIAKVADYTDESFFENYRYLKESFKLNYEEIINQFKQKFLLENNTIDSYFSSIKEKIIFDVRYKLLLKNKDEQLEYLNNIFIKEENEILNKFIEDKGNFELLEFINFVEENKTLIDKNAIVRLSKDLETIICEDDHIDFIVDEDIIEGLKIIYRNKIYDYSFGRNYG